MTYEDHSIQADIHSSVSGSDTVSRDVLLNEVSDSVTYNYVGPLGTSKPVFVWGLIGLILSCLVFTSPFGIAFSCFGLSKARRFSSYAGRLYGRAKTGKIMSVFGIVIGIIMTVFLTVLIVLLLLKSGRSHSLRY